MSNKTCKELEILQNQIMRYIHVVPIDYPIDIIYQITKHKQYHNRLLFNNNRYLVSYILLVIYLLNKYVWIISLYIVLCSINLKLIPAWRKTKAKHRSDKFKISIYNS